MIARVWHGWTTPENADAYERLLKGTIFPGIAAKGVRGYQAFGYSGGRFRRARSSSSRS